MSRKAIAAIIAKDMMPIVQDLYDNIKPLTLNDPEITGGNEYTLENAANEVVDNIDEYILSYFDGIRDEVVAELKALYKI